MTAAEALSVAIEALTEYPIGDELPDEYANAATVVAALRDRLKEEEAAIVVLRDRLFQSSTFAAAVGQDEPDSIHEDAATVCARNFEAIRATDALDNTDRSRERWELDAALRLDRALRAVSKEPPGDDK